MQVHVTVEDEGVFTSPYTATLTYVPSANPLGEVVCAENPHEYYNNRTPTYRRPTSRTSEHGLAPVSCLWRMTAPGEGPAMPAVVGNEENGSVNGRTYGAAIVSGRPEKTFHGCASADYYPSNKNAALEAVRL